MQNTNGKVAQSFYQYRRDQRDKYHLRRALENRDSKYFEAYICRDILDSPVIKQSKKDELLPYLEKLKELGLING